MYGNYNNYYLDHANRQAAQVAEGRMMDAQHAAAARANQASREFRQSYGDPRASQSNHDSMISQITSPYQQMMGQHEMAMRHAMQNAMSNEMAQVQDRMADLPENQVASKNASDRMRYLVEMDKQKKGYDLGMAQNRALSNMGNMNLNVGQGNNQMPSTTLFDNNGDRIGGSVPSSGSLFSKTGIKKSLMG